MTAQAQAQPEAYGTEPRLTAELDENNLVTLYGPDGQVKAQMTFASYEALMAQGKHR